MAINFPASPTANQVYLDTVSGVRYIYNSTYNFWKSDIQSGLFTANVVISVTDNSNAALRITQTGTGDAIRIEDETTPDSSPFAVDASGNVLIGRTNSTVGQSVKLDIVGAVNASAYLTGTGQAILNNSTTLVSTGYTVSSFNAGSNIAAYGTWQPNAANGNYQYATCNGAVTISTPPANCAIDILFINASNRNPGAVSFSGYNVSATPGSTYAVTANLRYILSIREINNISTYSWYAIQ